MIQHLDQTVNLPELFASGEQMLLRHKWPSYICPSCSILDMTRQMKLLTEQVDRQQKLTQKALRGMKW